MAAKKSKREKDLEELIDRDILIALRRGFRRFFGQRIIEVGEPEIDLYNSEVIRTFKGRRTMKLPTKMSEEDQRKFRGSTVEFLGVIHTISKDSWMLDERKSDEHTWVFVARRDKDVQRGTRTEYDIDSNGRTVLH